MMKKTPISTFKNILLIVSILLRISTMVEWTLFILEQLNLMNQFNNQQFLGET
jgi:hypothetical protein